MAKFPPLRPDLRRIISRIHQIIAGDDFACGQPHQGDGHLTVMDRSRRNNCADGQVNVGDIQLQRVTVPSPGIAPNIPLDTASLNTLLSHSGTGFHSVKTAVET